MKSFSILLLTVLGCCKLISSANRDPADNDVMEHDNNKYQLKGACTTLLRAQVNMEMYASLVYMSMAAHFNRNDIARKGFADLFLENSNEEREHALKIIHFINSRGQKITGLNIDMPDKMTWASGLEAIKDAIALENKVNDQLHHVHKVAEARCKDAHLTDFLEREFLDEQVTSIDEFIRHASELERIGEQPLGEYLYDLKLQNKKVEL